MQVVLGTAAAKVPLDEFLGSTPMDEVEIVDANVIALAYLIPAVHPGDETYARFEEVFQTHTEVLRHRAAKHSRGNSTEELLSRLSSLPAKADE